MSERSVEELLDEAGLARREGLGGGLQRITVTRAGGEEAFVFVQPTGAFAGRTLLRVFAPLAQLQENDPLSVRALTTLLTANASLSIGSFFIVDRVLFFGHTLLVTPGSEAVLATLCEHVVEIASGTELVTGGGGPPEE